MKFCIKRFTTGAAIAFALCLSATAHANNVFLDFQGVGNGALVNEYYNGGTDSFGNSGTNYGVQFVNFTAVASWAQFEAPSISLAFNSAFPAYVNVAKGFSGLSFTDGIFSAASLNVFSGMNGTGVLIGSIVLSGVPISFKQETVLFSGIGKSFTVAGNVNDVGISNLNITAAVPEPETYAMLLAGLGLIGAAVKRRKAKHA